MKLITLSRCLPSFEKKSRAGEEMRLPFLADASRHVHGCGVECIPSSIVSRSSAPSLFPLAQYIEKQGPGERREIRTSGLIKRYRNDNAVSRRSFGGTMGCIMAGMTRPFLSMATHRRRIVPLRSLYPPVRPPRTRERVARHPAKLFPER